MEKEGLWFKVLVTEYGMSDGRITGGGRQASLWWKDLCDVGDGVSLSIKRWFSFFGYRISIWFENNINRKVENREEPMF
jgi:hypothetical protein